MYRDLGRHGTGLWAHKPAPVAIGWKDRQLAGVLVLDFLYGPGPALGAQFGFRSAIRFQIGGNDSSSTLAVIRGESDWVVQQVTTDGWQWHDYTLIHSWIRCAALGAKFVTVKKGISCAVPNFCRIPRSTGHTGIRPVAA